LSVDRIVSTSNSNDDVHGPKRLVLRLNPLTPGLPTYKAGRTPPACEEVSQPVFLRLSGRLSFYILSWTAMPSVNTLQTLPIRRSSRRWTFRRRRRLNTLIFFVTSHCNATCATCFYWDELNQKGDLSWDEIVKLSENTPPITDLWFSGGEPTLRRELAEIIDLFVRNNGAQYINLPTNGLKPNRIYEVAEHCLSENPDLELHINIALDGLRESHDFMRGVPGNFEKALDSARLLRKLKPRFGRRLIVNINTVITRDNLDEILPLAEFIRAGRIADGHYFNLIRGDAKDPGLKKVEREKLRQIYSKLHDIQWTYADGMFDDMIGFVKWVKKVVYAGTLAFHHRTQFANLQHPSRWPMPCTAGETSAVIDFDGRIRACELRKPLANLRDHDMNLKVFWESPARTSEPHQIACDQCWCTHVCFIHDSLRYSSKTMLYQIPKNYFLRKAW
jgi:MoaA/NifB/PqqE/SkfB family radical SAM enzyme